MPPAVGKPADTGRRWALLVAAGAMALTMVPYLFGLSLVGARPAFGWFTWLGYNLDDSCVYLSWMRQAADGHFFQRNLFTTQPQIGHQFSVFFLALGWIAALTHLPLLAVYHGARLVLGVAFLRASWWLMEVLGLSLSARRAAYLVLCFSAGLGWVPGLWRQSGLFSPVDVWQPEAITFLCLYLSPLFLVSLLLMVGVIGWLLVGDRTGAWRPAVYAGVCGILLGNIHTYDVITLAAVWGGYLVLRTVVERRIEWQAWARAAVAGAMTAISTGQMFLLVKTEDVFARRVAVETLSPELRLYMLGYGLVLLLAVAGLAWQAWLWLHRSSGGGRTTGDDLSNLGDPRMPLPHSSVLFVGVWAVVNLAVAYVALPGQIDHHLALVPVPFQRKMLMGEHIPLAILAGIALSGLLARRAWRTWALAGVVLLLSLTNWRFMRRDMANYQADSAQTRQQRPYMYAGEVAALGWIREHTPAGVPIQPLPWVAATPEGKVAFFDATPSVFTPGLTGHPVNAGHWGETPAYGATMGQWVRFLLPSTTDAERRALLAQTGVQYVLFTQKHEEDAGLESAPLLTAFTQTPPSCLRLVPEASNADADVYEVVR